MITFRVKSGSFVDGVWVLMLDPRLDDKLTYPWPTMFSAPLPGLTDQEAIAAIREGSITFQVRCFCGTK